MAHSLRGRLLAWVMLPLAGAVVFDGVVSRQNAEATETRRRQAARPNCDA